MEYLINLVGNYSIGWGITIIAALVFLVLCYRKVESYPGWHQWWGMTK